MSNSLKILFVGIFFLISHALLHAQSVNFAASGLTGTNINNPTSLDFGPNNKLYVSQQNGIIWEYDVSRDAAAPGEGTYNILNSNQITLIKNNTPNHNDDGTFNSSQNRQITGLLAAGTISNPVLYVTSSDSRIGGGGGAGNDVNLDTNSGILSRLSWNGSIWEKVDLVRGLPRCEENHSTNGLDLFTSGGITYLLIQQGGNTNQGAPSNNFAGSSEFYLAGALLIVNITQLEQMEAANGGPYFDPRSSNTPFIYDLPSLNDPERLDIDNAHPSFPYSPSHPMYNAVIDLGDPFGGNNGLNQTFPENGGPVQIFSPGYRNAYDVVITTDGRIFTGDNGPNGGWGGTPLIYDNNDQLKGTHYTTTYDPAAGDYITNEFNIENGTSHGDALHYVGTVNDPNNTYYGGHPVAIRAFPDKAGVYKFEYDGNNWVQNGSYDWPTLIIGVRGYFNTGFTMADFPGDTRQGEYLADAILSPKVNILDIVGSSTNGICEYTASNFNGDMQGNILTASFNGNINRYILDTGDTTLLSKENGFLNGFGSIPLDVIAQGDNDPFPGTIWVATYGADDITVFEPGDFGDCPQPGDPEFDPLADYDGDGYSNQDELANGTNHCSGGSSPEDNDGDFISDLSDTDDDNDGIVDNLDVFAIDPQNGQTTNLPINYPFWNNDPGTGFFGLGFTGIMLDPSGSTDYLTQFDPDNLSFGGAGGKATVDVVTPGDALNGLNSQENSFQFGINVDENSNSFTIHAKIETPFNGSPPLPDQSYGIFIGNGDQDNYLKVGLMDGVNSSDGVYGFEIVLENNGVSTISSYDAPGLLEAAGVDLYISVNPELNSAQIFYSLNSGLDISLLGSPQTLPDNFLDAADNQGLAVGIIGTSGDSGSSFLATWDFIDITEDQSSSLESFPASLDFGVSTINSSPNELILEINNLGNPFDGSIEITQINITGSDANLFSDDLALPISVGPGSDILVPITFTPNAIAGTKSASLEIIHDGINSPLIVPLLAELTDSTPVARISAGSATSIAATDGGPDWESNPSNGAYNGVSYSVNTGNTFQSSFLYSNRHSSIPAYIDQSTFNGLFNSERWDPSTAPEMAFSIPVSDGNFTVNLFLGNSFSGTSQPGNRVFDILIEGIVVQDNLDLINTFGHQVAGMLSFPVTVSDGVLNIEFGHVVENPLINAIEIIQESLAGNQPPNAIASATPLLGEAPQEVSFTGSASTDDSAIASYAWDFKDGNTSTEADPLHTFTSVGTYDVTLTVTDTEGLTDVTNVIVEISADLPQSLTITPDPLDFGSAVINSNATIIDLVAFNNGGPAEPISINSINITGTDVSLFGYDQALPLTVQPQTSISIPITFTPNAIAGTKSASLEIIHDGINSPLIVPLLAELTDSTPVARISAGSATSIAATDGGPDWESNPSNGAYNGVSYSVNTGNTFQSSFLYSNRHSSIPAYIDQSTFNGLFNSERWDPSTAPEMAFSIPVSDGNFTVNLFLGNSFSGTSQPGNRVFDILIEGIVVQDNLDLINTFGHQVAGMLSFPVTVSDGVLNIEFGHVVENPLINAIEIIQESLAGNQPPNAIASATPLLGEAPQEVSFTGSASTDDSAIASYAWDFKDGNTSTEADPLHTFTSVGTYDVTLTVTDTEGLTDVTNVIVEISADLPQSLTITPDPLDFGSAVINSNATIIDLVAFNNGGPAEPISINSINITGTDVSLFGYDQALPLTVQPQTSISIPITFTPNAIAGTKSASLEIIHDGINSPLIVPLLAELTDYDPIELEAVADQFNSIGESSNLVIVASGGDPNENIVYAITGQPSGLAIEPTNGQITGIVEAIAASGGPNNDGIHLVTVTATKPGSTDATQQFTWTIASNSTNFWFDKNEDETYTARHECSFVQAGDQFYLFGGRENATTMDIYDYNSDSWNSLNNSIPKEFNHFQATEYQGLIWVIGAFKTNSFPNELPEDFIWAYNPATNIWIQGPEIPDERKRGSAGLVVYNDKFYIIGGNTLGHNGGYVSWFDEYDPATGFWTALQDAPRPRDHFHAAVISDKLYLASGRLSGGTGGTFGPVIPEVDVYDLVTSTWSTLPSSQNLPTPRAAAIVANFENKLIVAGGESLASTSAFDITEIYDPVSNSWSVGEPLVHERHGTQGIVSGNGIHVTAGSPVRGGGNQLNMEYYGADAPVGSPSIPSILSTASEINLGVGESGDIVLEVSAGNIGVIINSIDISGIDAGEFSINAGNLSNSLINNNSQHIVTITHIGAETNKNAVLTITYDQNSSLSVNILVGSGTVNQPPNAVASATPTNGTSPLEVFFTGSSSSDDNGISTYLWNFDDGTTSNEINPTHTFNQDGVYNVSLTVEDSEGLEDIASIQINVGAASQNGVVGFTLINANTDQDMFELTDGLVIDAASLQGMGLNIRANTNPTIVGSVSLSLTGPVNNTRTESVAPYALFGDASGNYSAQNLQTGTYTLSATAYSQAGLGGVVIGNQLSIQFSIEVLVNGNQAPNAVASATPTNGTSPLEVFFTGSSSSDDNGISTYLWNFDDGTTSNEINPTHTFNQDGVYNVSLTVEDTEGLEDIASIQIIVGTVNQPPNAVASATPTYGTSPLEVFFTGSSSSDDNGISTYLWDFDDGTTSNEINPTHTFNQDGVYNVSLTVSDSEGLEDIASIQINVGAASQNGVVGFTLINANTDQDMFELTDGLVIDAASLQGMGLNIRANTNPTIVGSVSLSLTGPVNNTRTESVAPYALFGDASGNYSAQNLLTGTYTLSATAYSQAGLGGVVIGTQLSIQFSIEVLVNGNQAPNAISSPDLNKNLEEIAAPPVTVSLSPNPANIQVSVNISSETAPAGIISVYSMDGKLVRQLSVNEFVNKDFTIQTYFIEEGIYIITIPMKDGRIITKYLVIRR